MILDKCAVGGIETVDAGGVSCAYITVISDDAQWIAVSRPGISQLWKGCAAFRVVEFVVDLFWLT